MLPSESRLDVRPEIAARRRSALMTEPTPDASPDNREASAVSFVGFVLSLAHTAAVHFGDVPDPVSGEPAQANLPASQQMIDILALLEEKTRGNLTTEERRLLEQVLYELRMRFVEVKTGITMPPAPAPSRIIIP
jgi:hypothetical protein